MRNRFRKWRNTSKVTQPSKYLNQVCLTPAPYVYSLSPPPTCLSIYLNITMRYTPKNWNLRSLKFHNLIINTNKGEKVGLSLFKAHLNNYFLFPSIWPIPGLFNSCTLKKWYCSSVSRFLEWGYERSRDEGGSQYNVASWYCLRKPQESYKVKEFQMLSLYLFSYLKYRILINDLKGKKISVRRKIKDLKECLWLKWADYVWTNCGLPTSEPFYIFGKFPTIWVFMRNKATFIIAVKIDRLLLSQPLWQLWHRSWASHEQWDTPTLGLQTSDSENRETLSWWLWWQWLPGQHHQQHQAAEPKANTSSG